MEREIKLMYDPLSKEEKESINICLESGQYTQGKLVEEFEREFAKWNESSYAVMVNSGSSANLIIIALLKKKFNIEDNAEVLVPAITWPTPAC